MRDETGAAGGDLRECGVATFPPARLGALVRLERLVGLEEMADLVEYVRALEVRQVVEVVPPLVGVGHAKNLRVRSGFVGHPKHAENARPDVTAGERRFFE